MATKSQTLSAKNKAFWAKSKEKQRIAVAEDVIKQVYLKFYAPTRGTYLKVVNLDYNIKAKPKLDDVFFDLNSAGASCAVCGIGGCFASLVRLGNNMSTKTGFGKTPEIEEYDSIDDDKMRILLRKVFPSEQITLIECAFETSTSHSDDDYVDMKEREKAKDFGNKYENEKTRLIGIMKNIIKNKGTFKP
jgi:hypothetical protein